MPTSKSQESAYCLILGCPPSECEAPSKFINHGFIRFIQQSTRMKIECHLQGLPPGEHGFHVHQSGDLSKGCSSLCSHLNPYGTTHGGRSDTKENRHVGDLGNIVVDTHGKCEMVMYDKLISFRYETNIIGRSIVIHQNRDDLGKGGNEESLKTGNAGKRIAFGIIGRC